MQQLDLAGADSNVSQLIACFSYVLMIGMCAHISLKLFNVIILNLIISRIP